jgi:hypothetical protein
LMFFKSGWGRWTMITSQALLPEPMRYLHQVLCVLDISPAMTFYTNACIFKITMGSSYWIQNKHGRHKYCVYPAMSNSIKQLPNWPEKGLKQA